MDVPHRVTDGVDRPDRLVADDAPSGHLWQVPFQYVKVTTAQGCGVHAHDRVGGIDHCRVGHVVPALVVRSVIHECFHGVSPWCTRLRFCHRHIGGPVNVASARDDEGGVAAASALGDQMAGTTTGRLRCTTRPTTVPNR